MNKPPNQAKDLINLVRISLEELWMVSDRIVDFHFFVKFHFLNSHATCYLCIKKASNQAKEFINMVSITLEGLRMVSDRIVDFRFFVKFHTSGPVIIFCFLTLTQHVSYASKNLLIKQKTSSTWWVLLWKDDGRFLIELSIFNFSSNMTCRDL